MSRIVRNPHAVLRLARPATPEAAKAVDTVDVRLGPAWVDPVDPMENWRLCRAQSLLAGLFYRDCSRNPGPLTSGQAQDVLRWANTL